jgi:two-component system, NarL family, invasion response regulator UvrY
MQAVASAPGPVPVVVVDDHELVRMGLCNMLLKIGGYAVVVDANDGARLVASCVAGQEVAIAIVDLDMPGMDGYMTMAWLREHRPTVLSLALCAELDDAATQRAFRAGARGVLLKNVSGAELARALHDVRTSGHHRNALMDCLLLGTAHRSPADLMRQPKRETPLSPRERELVRWLAHPDHLTVAAIAPCMGVAESTVRTWCKSIHRKLNVHSRDQVVRYALKHRIAFL